MMFGLLQTGHTSFSIKAVCSTAVNRPGDLDDNFFATDFSDVTDLYFCSLIFLIFCVICVICGYLSLAIRSKPDRLRSG